MITMDDLKEMNVSAREFSKGLALYLGVEWNEAFYNHTLRVIKGEMDPSYEEQIAMDRWKAVHASPHEVGAKYMELLSKRSSIELLRKYMRSGIYPTTQTELIFSKILQLL